MVLDSNIASVAINILIFVGIFLIAVSALLLLRKLYSLYYQLRVSSTLLEVTPPAFNDKSALATETLLSALYGLGMTRSVADRILGRKVPFSLEIVSTKKTGIRFVIRVHSEKAQAVEQILSSYLPESKVVYVNDYLPSSSRLQRIVEFKQTKHFAYPLKDHEELKSHDPIGYITSAMTKLKSNELISYQIVFNPEQVREARSMSKKILKNDNALPEFGPKTTVLNQIAKLLNMILFSITDVFSLSYNSSTRFDYLSAQRELDYKKQAAKGTHPVRTLSYFEHELVESVHLKLSRPLFRANIRTLIVSGSKPSISSHRKSLSSAMSLYSVPKYQTLKPRHRHVFTRRLRKHLFTNRLIWPTLSPMYLSANELAGLYHFPHSESAKTENVNKSLSKTLPAPVSLKNGAKLDVLVGENHHHGQVTPIGLTEAERERHMYIIGGTGNGKTTMMMYSIVQDIQNGKGVAVIDPHGDLAESILGQIPEGRIKDVVYINPDDLGHPVGINLMELQEGLTGDDLLREKDLVTESTISVLRKIFSEDDSGGHRIEYILRNTIQTALTLDEANLFTIFRLINDVKYRKKIVNSLDDADLKIFWKNELGKAGEMQKVKMAAGITSKIGRFLFSAAAKRMLEQNKSTIDFDSIMDEKKILICNFSKGLIGEDTSMLFGVTILAKLQLAALRRARQAQVDRSSFYLYVDEFQNFATMSFVQMLSEARKYKLFLTMAEQSTQQQEDYRLVDVILANVGTVVAFRSGSPADERLIVPLFKPYVDDGELSNLPAYNFYARIAAVEPQEPLSGVTVLQDREPDKDIAKQVVDYSRKKYGKSPPRQKSEPKKPATQKVKKPKKSKPKTQARPIKEVA